MNNNNNNSNNSSAITDSNTDNTNIPSGMPNTNTNTNTNTNNNGSSTNLLLPNNTGNSLLNSRISQSRHFGLNNNNTGNTANNQINSPTINSYQLNGGSSNNNNRSINSMNNMNNMNNNQPSFNPNWLPQQMANPLMNVTPWIEHQAQISPNIQITNLDMTSLNDQQQQNNNPHSHPHHQDESIKSSKNDNLSSLKDSNKSIDANSSTVAINGSEPNDDSSNNQNQDSSNASSTHNANTNANANQQQPSIAGSTIDDDELIPTAIVIKNIPFAIKKEQLLDVMTKLHLPLPYAFNYHFDNGVFRGLAFANFNSTDETSMVVNILNGREIGGRKLRVEYKKMLPLVERERIEREKREKRGQLEEQHRSASSTSLASLYSISSAPASSNPAVAAAAAAAAAAKFGGLNNLNHQHMAASALVAAQQQAQLQAVAAIHSLNGNNSSNNNNTANNNTTPNANVNANTTIPSSSFNNQANLIQSDRLYTSLPPLNLIPQPPTSLDMNSPETLEIYTRMVVFRDENKERSIQQQQQQQQSSSTPASSTSPPLSSSSQQVQYQFSELAFSMQITLSQIYNLVT
ncbi:unnamed protein product [[Candida] boidinii]|nr:unnamed protein product [[Candida] boidinii]